LLVASGWWSERAWWWWCLVLLAGGTNQQLPMHHPEESSDYRVVESCSRQVLIAPVRASGCVHRQHRHPPPAVTPEVLKVGTHDAPPPWWPLRLSSKIACWGNDQNIEEKEKEARGG